MSRYWAIVPAAGAGRRMESATPKQYLDLLGKPVLLHTLNRLAAVSAIEGIVVAISEGDGWWPEVEAAFDRPMRVVHGGRERVHSVFNAVAAIAPELGYDDWLLVHDAARPCVTVTDIEQLIQTVGEHECGGILAAPVNDTMKQSNGAHFIEKTIDRSLLWRAFTPQLFRAPVLHAALEAGLGQVQKITDEASAMELAGYHPVLVEGSGTNLKITRPEDLTLAAFYLQQQAGGTVS